MATIFTKWFSSTMGGAPVLTYAAGSFISVLDAALLNGFGSVTLDALVIANNVATLTKNTGHGFLDQQVIEIAGATPAALNGQWRFNRLSNTQGTFYTSGIANQTATGTITAKTPPLGWTKPFSDSGTSRAAFRNNPLTGTGSYLWISDPGSAVPRVRGFAAMTSIDAGTDPFPTDAQSSGGAYFPKPLSALTVNWIVVGDDKGFYYSLQFSNGSLGVFFGDALSAYPSDPWCCFISGTNNNAGTQSVGYLSFTYGNDGLTWMARNHQGASGSILCSKRGLFPNSGYNTQYNYPSPLNNGIIAQAPVYIEQYQGDFRGIMPGYVAFLNNCGSALAPGMVLSGVTGFPDPILCIKESLGALNPYIFGVSLGPWR